MAKSSECRFFFFKAVDSSPIRSMALVFRTLYGFEEGPIGLMFLSVVYVILTILGAHGVDRIIRNYRFGSVFALLWNFVQEYLYKKYVGRKGPEARLYSACMAAVLFPIGAFSSRPIPFTL